MSLDPYNPYRVFRYIDDVPAMKGDDSGPRPELVKPRMALLYPSMTCNQRCEYCYYLSEHSHKAFMATGKIKEVFEDAVRLGIEGVELCGGGEPLLHPDIMEWLEYGLALGLKFGVLTHGAIPKKPDLFKLIGQYFSYMRVSLDYADKEKYARTRRTSEKMYDWALQNIQETIRHRDDADSNCKISIKATTWEQSPEDVAAFCYLGKRLGVDSIQVKTADEVENDLTSDPNRKGQIINILENLKRDADMPKILYNFKSEKLTHVCWAHQLHTFINTDGNVFLCCYHHDRRESHCIGNVNEDRLTDIWASDRHKKAIMGTDPNHCNNYSCRFIGYMNTLDKAIDEDAIQMQFV